MQCPCGLGSCYIALTVGGDAEGVVSSRTVQLLYFVVRRLKKRGTQYNIYIYIYLQSTQTTVRCRLEASVSLFMLEEFCVFCEAFGRFPQYFCHARWLHLFAIRLRVSRSSREEVETARARSRNNDGYIVGCQSRFGKTSPPPSLSSIRWWFWLLSTSDETTPRSSLKISIHSDASKIPTQKCSGLVVMAGRPPHTADALSFSPRANGKIPEASTTLSQNTSRGNVYT